ncbi:Glycosyltransferase (GlcNAc) [Seminavis robusta]|uniref:Glycosyltransferase (GlcNAc) n=1 Tax=Seminavis robusta TaxID=568900 RepID=A0A9N8HCH9_9STRA|nr:Glycosyltransferase (GlcNAc) [Seminavis robusta]|eukprot:Sro218_g090180.1 Glycosyltransferase (GlcNAc) (573) ;mRNA; f:68047-70054
MVPPTPPPHHQVRRKRSRQAFGVPQQVVAGIILLLWLGVLLVGVAVCHRYDTTSAATSTDAMTFSATANRRNLREVTSAVTALVVSDSQPPVPVPVPEKKPALALDEIVEYLEGWITQLHKQLLDIPRPAAVESVWEAFHNLTEQTLYPWDQEYLTRMPTRRTDGSIFLSVISYRDEHCTNTLEQAYAQAQDPDNLFVGLVQQNCYKDCRTGLQEDGLYHKTDPDPDCYETFCQTDVGAPHCQAGRVRVLRMEEPESLGPYMARYLASKIWYGEEYYIQIDSHMTFAQSWDAISISSLQKAPSNKPVISHYPPSHKFDLKTFERLPASRICGPIFTPNTIRLEGSQIWDIWKLDTPRFAPVLGAGYVVAQSSILKEVPYDPFLPWVFMGEEIILSARLWTAGYDFFSPAQAVLGHIYNREHTPKFWESVHRAFTPGLYNEMQELVGERIKHQLDYPEYSRDMVASSSILTASDQYAMGTTADRTLDDYMKMIGMNTTTKEVTRMEWCEHGQPPPGFEQYKHLYEHKGRTSVRRKTLAQKVASVASKVLVVVLGLLLLLLPLRKRWLRPGQDN